MNPIEALHLKKSRFTELIVRENSLDASGFQDWYFYPGMLFNEMDKWWGNGGKREKPHEGVDLCYYKSRQNEVLQLDETIRVPALYDGVVVRVMDDFIGKSVVVEHRYTDKNPLKFCTIYGHTTPLPDLRENKTVKEGEILATLALPDRSKGNIPPHLHLSVGWIVETLSFQDINWEILNAIRALKWVDPLQVI